MSLCTYCGAEGGGYRDHVIPVSYTSTIRSFHKGATVPCCKECNSTLSDKMYCSVPDRAKYLFDRYTYKYKKLLETPSWSDDELEEMSNTLKKGILDRLAKREIVSDRIDRLHLVSLGFDIWTNDIYSANAMALAALNLTYNQITDIEDDDLDFDESAFKCQKRVKPVKNNTRALADENHPKKPSKPPKKSTKSKSKQTKTPQKQAKILSPFERYLHDQELIKIQKEKDRKAKQKVIAEIEFVKRKAEWRAEIARKKESKLR